VKWRQCGRSSFRPSAKKLQIAGAADFAMVLGTIKRSDRMQVYAMSGELGGIQPSSETKQREDRIPRPHRQ